MNKTKITGSLMLMLTALIWGIAFVAQSVSMDYIGPFTFNAIRNLIGGVVLIPVILVMDYLKKKSPEYIEPALEAKKHSRKLTIWGGIFCGIALAAASMVQQMGIQHTTVGKAGFITALYIIIVPFLGLFLGKKITRLMGISALIAVCGLYLLCMSGSFSLQKGDILVMACAFLFSIHILVVDYFSPKGEGVKISCVQFLVCAIICGMGMLVFEKPEIADILAAYVPILYAGIMSCGVAYTLQILGQKRIQPTIASLIMSLESVFSVLAGWIILGQSLRAKEIIGCALMFAAIVLAQLPDKKVKH